MYILSKNQKIRNSSYLHLFVMDALFLAHKWAGRRLEVSPTFWKKEHEYQMSVVRSLLIWVFNSAVLQFAYTSMQ